MPEIQREIFIDAPINTIWNYVKDIGNWAKQMPGYEEFELINEDDSVWTLNVNIGPFNRNEILEVHVTQWNEPNSVTFELKGRNDPIIGEGSYNAKVSNGGTSILLSLTIGGSGSMSGMMNAMAGPVVKKVAQELAQNLKQAIEEYVKS